MTQETAYIFEDKKKEGKKKEQIKGNFSLEKGVGKEDRRFPPKKGGRGEELIAASREGNLSNQWGTFWSGYGNIQPTPGSLFK